MRTTLDIDDDVLAAAKERARREQKSIGQVVSELARHALNAPHEPPAVYGVQPFERRGTLVTNDLIDRLRHDDSY